MLVPASIDKACGKQSLPSKDRRLVEADVHIQNFD